MSAAVRSFQIVSWLFWFYLHLQHYFTCYSAYKRLPTKKEAYDVHFIALFNLCCCYEGLFTSSARVEMLNYEVNFFTVRAFPSSLNKPSCYYIRVYKKIKNCLVKCFFQPLIAADVRPSCGIIKEEEDVWGDAKGTEVRS